MSLDTLTMPVTGITYRPDDPDSPFQENLTPLGLHRLINMSMKWIETYTLAGRIPGQHKCGKCWRYTRADVILQRMTAGQVLLPSKKKAGHGR